MTITKNIHFLLGALAFIYLFIVEIAVQSELIVKRTNPRVFQEKITRIGSDFAVLKTFSDFTFFSPFHITFSPTQPTNGECYHAEQGT